MDFDITYPIDISKGLEIFGGNKPLFYQMLDKMEGMTFTLLMGKLAEDFENRSDVSFQEYAH